MVWLSTNSLLIILIFVVGIGFYTIGKRLLDIEKRLFHIYKLLDAINDASIEKR
jgi:hypothetical protein